MAYGQYNPNDPYGGDVGYEPGLTAQDINDQFGGSYSYAYPSSSESPSAPYQAQETPYPGGPPYSQTPSAIGGGGYEPGFAPSGTKAPNSNLASLGSKPFYAGLPRTVSTQQKILPTGVNPPAYPTSLPEYKIPEYDTKRVQSLTELAAGPTVRELRSQMRQAQGKYYENPNVKRMTLRDALAGYGLGLEKAMGGARKQAVEEYQAEYAPKLTQAQMTYQAQINQMNAQYQAAYQDYMNRVAQQTMTQYAPQSQ